ncbi:hypothetical protein SISSUDRAFT_1060785 [Sistotremastrum suecicum HHB10207 ss-3]|uniref:Uncharacterized protein n=1 Tax=Sistotremastrum suecicum HHB10207 ss-3 TaxID=1314776 RepID=A0A166ERK0_9AGAM|nr:hypothetical protein SISSUDRAFT_1060785 [Sistotremastrum suecicum HHB10207 ss-3]
MTKVKLDVEEKVSPTTPDVESRPALPKRTSSMDSRYMQMLIAHDSVNRWNNFLAAFFTWLVLAGFILFPGTFTNIQELESVGNVQVQKASAALLNFVNRIPLLAVAGTCCAIGALGMLWLWYKFRANYVWLIDRLFVAGAVNSFTGVISTLTNVFGSQNGNFSITARVTIIVTSVSCVICSLLWLFYLIFKLAPLRYEHRREYGSGEKARSCTERIFGLLGDLDPAAGPILK